MELTIEQVSFLRDLKGAPASILLALSLTGLSLRQKDLELATGYSDKTVSRGLALLELHRLIQHNGRPNGWCLPNNLQLHLFPPAQLGGGTRRISAFHLLSSSSSNPDHSESKLEEVEESSHPNPENFRHDGSSSIAKLLIQAGVGRSSPKMRQLLSLQLDKETVTSWVHYFQWWQRESARLPGQPIDGRSQFSTGTLIKILLDGDDGPAPRCAQCLELLPCYCDVIRS